MTNHSDSISFWNYINEHNKDIIDGWRKRKNVRFAWK